MSHKHHNCSCAHENVKYCSTCRVVHCIDCNQEWTAKTTYAWQYQPYWNTSPTIGGNWKDQLEKSNGVDMTPQITYTAGSTCEHK